MYLLPRKGGRRLSIAIHPAGTKPVVAFVALRPAEIPSSLGPDSLAGRFGPCQRPKPALRSSAIQIRTIRVDPRRSHFVLVLDLTILRQCNLSAAFGQLPPCYGRQPNLAEASLTSGRERESRRGGA